MCFLRIFCLLLEPTNGDCLSLRLVFDCGFCAMAAGCGSGADEEAPCRRDAAARRLGEPLPESDGGRELPQEHARGGEKCGAGERDSLRPRLLMV